MAFAVRLLQRAYESTGSPSFLLLASFLLPLFFIWLARWLRYLRSLPPGPTGYPILGILPLITKQFHLQLFDYARQFGRVLSMKMGGQLVVVLNDPNLIKKAFARPEFSGRPQSPLNCILDGYGIISSVGSLWSAQRRFIHKHKFGLKHWGNIGEKMESCVMHEVRAFLSTLAAETRSPINPAPILNCFISNVICSITMSTRFLHTDLKFRRFMHLFDEGFRLFTQTGALIFLPILRHLPGMRTILEQLDSNRQEMLVFVKKIVADHEASLDPRSPRDLVDSYLLEMQAQNQATANGQLFLGKDPRTQLYQIMLDLFSAGVETLKTTLQWGLLHMLYNPEVKARVQAELERVVGPNRLPTMADMAELPYTRATIYEVQRRSNVVPMGTTHATDRCVELEGHLIPKDSQVIPNLYAVHMSPDLWEAPEEFRPERFLTPDGLRVQKPKHFMPFGVGQRMCLGDSLAEMELQLFFASMLHVFDVANPGNELPTMEGVLGATVTPKDFEINFVPRNVEALIAANARSKSSCWNPDVRIYG